MIPKRIAFFWSGSRMSWLRYMTLYSFKKLNPEWQVDLYTTCSNSKESTWKTPVKQDFLLYKGQNYFSKVESLKINVKIWNPLFDVSQMVPIVQSDIFQWWYLSKFGGFYADMDILWIKSIESLYKDVRKFDTMVSLSKFGEQKAITIGFLASGYRNVIFENTLLCGLANICHQDYQSAGAFALKRALLRCDIMVEDTFIEDEKEFNKKIVKNYSKNKIFFLPETTVYPYKYTEVNKLFSAKSFSNNNLPEETIGIHWYGGLPMAQKFNRGWSEKNYKKVKNILSFYITKLFKEAVKC